jgi:hypothetical protein
MKNSYFKEIIVFKDFELENGVLGLERDVYLSIVKFLDSSILRKVWVNVFFCLIFICVFYSILALVKNHIHKWNTFISWFIDWKVLLFVVIYLFFIY